MVLLDSYDASLLVMYVIALKLMHSKSDGGKYFVLFHYIYVCCFLTLGCYRASLLGEIHVSW